MHSDRMANGPRVAAVVLFLFLFGGLAGVVAPAGAKESEERLQSRLEREADPVKRAKFEIRLGRRKLLQAIEAYDQGNFGQGQQLLAAYWERMKSAWATLHASGRQASQKPQGFKELDIALREDGRLFEDLAHRVSYHDRGPVEKLSQEVEALRNQVLKALFPSTHLRKQGNRFASRGGLGWHTEMVRQ